MIRKKNERDFDVVDDRFDFLSMPVGGGQVIQSHRHSPEKNKDENAFRRHGELFECLLGIGGERLRLPIAFQREVNFSTVQLQQADPVFVSSLLEDLL